MRRVPSDFAYAQARIQSRHGERPSALTWERLHASRDLGHLLEAARSGALEGWLERVSASTDVHAIERAFRRTLRDHVHEVAGWVPERWQPAVRWTARLVDLPALERLLGPEPPPAWLADDPALAPFALDDREDRAAAMRDAGLRIVVEAVQDGRPARAGWRSRFDELLPGEPRGAAEVGELARRLEEHVERMKGDPAVDGWELRNALEGDVGRAFRWNALRPMAVFAHLALVALDLEKLRGAVVRRRLFPDTRSEVSWV